MDIESTSQPCVSIHPSYTLPCVSLHISYTQPCVSLHLPLRQSCVSLHLLHHTQSCVSLLNPTLYQSMSPPYPNGVTPHLPPPNLDTLHHRKWILSLHLNLVSVSDQFVINLWRAVKDDPGIIYQPAKYT